MGTADVWHWCSTHRRPERPGESVAGCTLAGPFDSRDEAERFGHRPPVDVIERALSDVLDDEDVTVTSAQVKRIAARLAELLANA
jgi:hypothetical protein